MKVKFQTKEESKQQQREAFLKLSGAERFMRFLDLSRAINRIMPVKNKMSFEGPNKGNFLMVHPDLKDKKKDENIDKFIELANKYNVRMMLVDGGAVNYHGYQRHSADVVFWIDTQSKNMAKLINVFHDLGYGIETFPDAVLNKKQIISLKFSPHDLDLELITRFSINKTFSEAYQESEIDFIRGEKLLRWNVLGYDDLITSKIKSSRPKDLLDIQQLKEIKENK